MAYIKTCAVNFLDNSTITFPNGGTPTGAKQAYRLWDRQFDKLFQNDSLGAALIIRIQQAAYMVVDRLIIPSPTVSTGSATCYLEYSDNGSSFTTVTSFMIITGQTVNVTFSAPVAHPYWQLRFTGPLQLSAAEMFLSPTVTWTGYPAHPYGPQELVFNVEDLETVDKRHRFIVNGASRRQRHYNLELMDDTFKAQVNALWEAWAGCKPFFVIDHDSVLIPMTFIEEPEFETNAKGAHAGEVHLIEAL